MAQFIRWRIFVSLLGIISLFSLLYQGTLLLDYSNYILLNKRMLSEQNEGDSLLHLLNKRMLPEQNEGESFVACKLPELDPFHPSVTHFIKDLGKLYCDGVSYSSFENNVLRVEGEDVFSAQYRKIDRPPRNDFDVALSDPVSVRNAAKKRNRIGGCFE